MLLLNEITLTTDEVTQAVTTSLWSHAYTVGGVLLVLFALARVTNQRRQPGNTLAWLLIIILLPYVGVPLFFLFGGQKIRRLVARKRRIRLPTPHDARASDATRNDPVALSVRTSGAGEPVAGNTVRLLTTGEDTFAELEKRILAARHTIHIATYILSRDRVGKHIIALLARRAREGIKVRLQLDALGCFFSSGSFVDPLRAAGGEVAKFLPVIPLSSRGSANLRNHRKIAVFDHQIAIIGGHNLAREYMGPQPWKKRWTDIGAVIEGPGAALLDDVFLADWIFATGRPVDEPSFAPQPGMTAPATPTLPHLAGQPVGELQVVASGPDVIGDPLYEGILSMIQEAKQSIWIVTPYFIPDEVLLRSLIVKARAGRDVTLILPEHSNHPVTDLARRPALRLLVRAGARVLVYQPRMMHAKAILVDDRQAILGSANLDMRSLFVNFEIGVLFHTAADVRPLRVWAGELVRDSRRLTLADLRRRRFPANLAEDLSRLFTPLL